MMNSQQKLASYSECSDSALEKCLCTGVKQLLAREKQAHEAVVELHQKSMDKQQQSSATISELQEVVAQLQKERAALLDHIVDSRAASAAHGNADTAYEQQGAHSAPTSEPTGSPSLREGVSTEINADLLAETLPDDVCKLGPFSQVGPHIHGGTEADGNGSPGNGPHSATQLVKALQLLRTIKQVLAELPDGGASICKSLSARLQPKNCAAHVARSETSSDASTVGACNHRALPRLSERCDTL